MKHDGKKIVLPHARTCVQDFLISYLKNESTLCLFSRCSIFVERIISYYQVFILFMSLFRQKEKETPHMRNFQDSFAFSIVFKQARAAYSHSNEE